MKKITTILVTSLLGLVLPFVTKAANTEGASERGQGNFNTKSGLLRGSAHRERADEKTFESLMNSVSPNYFQIRKNFGAMKHK